MLVLIGIILKLLLMLLYGGFLWGLIFLVINKTMKIINKRIKRKMHWEARTLLALILSGYLVVVHFAYLERIMI